MLAPATLAAAESSPYEARVRTPRAQVRSGPGEQFYPTETLPQGDTVEVYREQPDGWLAIRPPDGSFSWVSSQHLTLSDGKLGEIAKDNVASRIGSRLSDKRNAAQVRLKKGEVVEIFGEQKIGGELWYQIAPPAGEFRWIHATDVERIGPISSAADEPEATLPVVVASATTDEATTSEGEAPQTGTAAPVASASAEAGDQWRVPTPGAASTPADISAPPLATIESNPAPPAATTSPPAAAIPPPAAIDVTAGSAAADDLSRQLTEIEMRLSRMAAAPPQQWNTERLARDTEQLLAQAQTPAERDMVKVTLAKIDRFATIGRRYQQGSVMAGPQVMAGSPDPAMPMTAGLQAGAGPGDPRTTTTPPSAAAAASLAAGGRYDAVGILRPVVSKRAGAPQFALVDERGQVVTFVTPSPDVNLQPYLGRRIGVAGNRGFISEFNRAHVTAGRVTPLTQGLIR